MLQLTCAPLYEAVARRALALLPELPSSTVSALGWTLAQRQQRPGACFRGGRATAGGAAADDEDGEDVGISGDGSTAAAPVAAASQEPASSGPDQARFGDFPPL